MARRAPWEQLTSTEHLTCSGLALVEFAMIVPLLLLIVVSGVELSRYLQRVQSAVSLSRELSSIAFRDCVADAVAVGVVPVDQVKCNVQVCLERAFRSVTPIAEQLFPDSRLFVSVYQFSGGQTLRLGIAAQPGTATESLYSLTAEGVLLGPTGEPLTQLMLDHKTIAIGEVAIPFTPVIGMMPGIANFPQTVLYDSSLL